MGTDIRPEVTKQSEYWISKHRYYELKHFCLQYKEWKEEYAELDGMFSLEYISSSTSVSSPVEDVMQRRLYLSERIGTIEQLCYQAAHDLESYLFKAVTENLSYDYLYSRLEIPCCRSTYYKLYRRFFWLLDKVR